MVSSGDLLFQNLMNSLCNGVEFVLLGVKTFLPEETFTNGSTSCRGGEVAQWCACSQIIDGSPYSGSVCFEKMVKYMREIDVLSCLYDNACKRSPAICHKSVLYCVQVAGIRLPPGHHRSYSAISKFQLKPCPYLCKWKSQRNSFQSIFHTKKSPL